MRHKIKRHRVVTLILMMVLAAFAVGCSGATRGTSTTGGIPSDIRFDLASGQKGIWVSGLGKVTVAPNIALLGLGISVQATSVAEAQSQATSVMEKVMTALTGNGVDKKDIQTRQFSIDQVTRWDERSGQQIVLGYRVTNMVTVKIRKIERAGAIIDGVAAAGGNFTRINSISFTVDDATPYQKEARDKAMADAKAKAEQLASRGGVKLGKPIYISESALYTPPVPMPAMKESLATAETPISPGELEVSLSVQVNYAILE